MLLQVGEDSRIFTTCCNIYDLQSNNGTFFMKITKKQLEQLVEAAVKNKLEKLNEAQHHALADAPNYASIDRKISELSQELYKYLYSIHGQSMNPNIESQLDSKLYAFASSLLNLHHPLDEAVENKSVQLQEKAPLKTEDEIASENEREKVIRDRLGLDRKSAPRRPPKVVATTFKGRSELYDLVSNLSRELSVLVHGEDLDYEREIEDGIEDDLFNAVAAIRRKYTEKARRIISYNKKHGIV